MPPSANRSDSEILLSQPPPGRALPSPPSGEVIAPPHSRQGWVVRSGARLPLPTDGSCGPDVRSPQGGNRLGASFARHPGGSRLFHVAALPGPSPGAEQLRPVPRPQPLSQLSLGWGRAAGEQLQGVESGCSGALLQQPETVSLPGGGGRGRGAGGRGRGSPGGMVGPSAPPPAHLAGQLRVGQTPDQSPLPASKGTLGAGEADGAAGNTLNREAAVSASQGPLWRSSPRVLT